MAGDRHLKTLNRRNGEQLRSDCKVECRTCMSESFDAQGLHEIHEFHRLHIPNLRPQLSRLLCPERTPPAFISHTLNQRLRKPTYSTCILSRPVSMGGSTITHSRRVSGACDNDRRRGVANNLPSHTQLASPVFVIREHAYQGMRAKTANIAALNAPYRPGRSMPRNSTTKLRGMFAVGKRAGVLCAELRRHKLKPPTRPSQSYPKKNTPEQ